MEPVENWVHFYPMPHTEIKSRTRAGEPHHCWQLCNDISPSRRPSLETGEAQGVLYGAPLFVPRADGKPDS